MSKRGPKPGPKIRFTPAPGRIDSPVELNADERAEFDRLVELVNGRGLLARIDPAALADLARAQVTLNGLYAAKARNVKAIAQMQNVVRGLRRETGISIQPSRVMLRTTPGEATSSRAYWTAKLAGGE